MKAEDEDQLFKTLAKELAQGEVVIFFGEIPSNDVERREKELESAEEWILLTSRSLGTELLKDFRELKIEVIEVSNIEKAKKIILEQSHIVEPSGNLASTDLGLQSLPPFFGFILLFTPLCLLFIPGFMILHIYEVWKNKADNWNWISDYFKIVFISMAFWASIASVCILIWG